MCHWLRGNSKNSEANKVIHPLMLYAIHRHPLNPGGLRTNIVGVRNSCGRFRIKGMEYVALLYVYCPGVFHSFHIQQKYIIINNEKYLKNFQFLNSQFYSVSEALSSACSTATASDSTDYPFCFRPKRRPASVHQGGKIFK